jgi:transposase
LVCVQPFDTGRLRYQSGTTLKLSIYGCLIRIPSSRRPEGNASANIEMIWSTGQPAPDFKIIADFRKDHDKAIREVCSLRYAANLIRSVKRAVPLMDQNPRLSMRASSRPR